MLRKGGQGRPSGIADPSFIFDPPFLTFVFLKFCSFFSKFWLGLWPANLWSLPWGPEIPSLENIEFLQLQKVQYCYFSTYSWALLRKVLIRTILELLQILAISALYSKTVKKLRLLNFFLSLLLVNLSFPPRFHDISHLHFS